MYLYSFAHKKMKFYIKDFCDLRISRFAAVCSHVTEKNEVFYTAFLQ